MIYEDVGLRITAITRLKQADIRQALRERGWSQKRGAEFCGLKEGQFGDLINLKWLPEEFSPELSIKLAELTGKTTEELFPEFMRSEEFLSRPKVAEKTFEFTPRMLADLGLLQIAPAPDEALEKVLLREELENSLNKLSKVQQRVIKGRYFDGKTLDEIAAEFGLDRSRIAQIENKAIRNLRHPQLSRRLRNFLP